MLRQLLLSIVGFNFIALVYIMWKFFTDTRIHVSPEVEEAHRKLEISTAKILNKHAEILQTHDEYFQQLEKTLKDINNNVDNNHKTIKHLIDTAKNDCDILEGIDKRIDKLEQTIEKKPKPKTNKD